MHPVRRRGFTLAELIVALVLSVIVGFAIVRMMNSSQRLTRVQYARIDSQQSALSAVYYFNALLRELDASEGDVQTATPTLLQVRAMRWTAISCSPVTTSGSDLQITIKNSQTFGARGPSVALDSLLVFDEKTPATRSDDVWLVGWLTGTAAGNCADGTPGLVLSLRITAAGGGNAECSANCTQGSPIRGFQVEELSLYNDGAGAYWLGRRSKDLSGTWSAMEQVAGHSPPVDSR